MKLPFAMLGLLMLTGCVTDGTSADRWAVRRHIDTPAGQAEMARANAEAEERSARAAAQDRIRPTQQQQGTVSRADADAMARQRARSECLRRVTESVNRQTYGQQSWRYQDNC
ncbi:hypothetical protein [Pseudorhodoplanes sp.]|uniref:hypothetical protein n=1 Tax=Pseudorhodoplanes sp. TaxID=1934341 RepID=UPI003D0A1861